MLWYEWLIVILFFTTMAFLGACLCIWIIEELFPTPNIFDKAIYTIYKCFKSDNSKYPKTKPRQTGMFYHNIRNDTKECNNSTDNYNCNNNPESASTHFYLQFYIGLGKRIIKRLLAKSKRSTNFD